MMISTVRRFSLVALVLALGVGMALSGVSALDWGGSLTTVNTVQTRPEGSDDPLFTNTERLTLYLNVPLGARYTLETQGAARLDANPLLLAADVERFYLQRTRNPQQGNLSEFVTRLGRLTIADPAGVVVRQTVDGAALVLRYPRAEVGMSAGYTGFINKEFTSATMTLRDSTDQEDDDIYFGPARVVGQGRVILRNLLAQQTLSTALTFQNDLRDPEKVAQAGDEQIELLQAGRELGGLLDTQYIQLMVDGPIPIGTMPGQLFHETAYVLNFGRTLSLVDDDTVPSGSSYQYKPIRGHLAKVSLNYFLPDLLGTYAGLGVMFSSGDSSYLSFTEGNRSDVSTMFTPMTPTASGVVFAANPGNITVLEVFYSLRPLENENSPFLNTLQTQVAWYSFFRSAGSGAVSSSDIDPASSATYIGSEVDLIARFRPYSDFGFGVSTGLFFANGSALAEGANDVDVLVRLDASLSF
ncbi:MAG: hypothetical protein EA427_00165 [Spirochaetaceae bacterium]|nr:MAG: hypothetical protein EA427_00165 [Spirochaetaceae bacterium]